MNGTMAIKFRMDNGPYLVGTDRSSHEGFGKLVGQLQKTLSLLQSHGDRSRTLEGWPQLFFFFLVS